MYRATKSSIARKETPEKSREGYYEKGSEFGNINKPTLEEFKLMVYRDREKRRRRQFAFLIIVLGCLLVLLVR